MTVEDVLFLLSSKGFLSPKAARYDFLGAEKMVFLGALPYHENEPGNRTGSSRPQGRIAPFAQRNYYRAAVLELKKVISLIGNSTTLLKKETSIFCNSRLPEKAMAASSGVGAYGKNSLVLVHGTGSLCILAGFSVPASLFSNGADLEKDFPLLSLERETLAKKAFPRCGSCEACISACPTHAIAEPGSIERPRCIQNLTTSTQIISEDIMEKWGLTIYGCQVCQEVCPENRNAVTGFHTREGEVGPSLPLELLLSGKREEISARIKNSVMDRKWIPRDALLRNALIAAGNSKNIGLKALIEPFLDDSREFIRTTASWAYRKITSTVS